MCVFYYVHRILYDILTVHWSHAEKKGGKGPMNCKDEWSEWRPIMHLEQHERDVTAREMAQIESSLWRKGAIIFGQ